MRCHEMPWVRELTCMAWSWPKGMLLMRSMRSKRCALWLASLQIPLMELSAQPVSLIQALRSVAAPDEDDAMIAHYYFRVRPGWWVCGSRS